MRNLTWDEAKTRAAAVSVTSYEVALDLTCGPQWFTSTSTITFTAQPGATTFLELDCLTLLQATLDGRPLVLEGNRIVLDGLGGEHVATVVARCAYTRTGEGLHRFVDPADEQVYIYAQAFLDDAQRFFACFDQPDLKAPYTLSVTAPTDHVVRSNMQAHLLDGVHVFATTPPMSTYMLTLAAGPWHGVTATHDGIELGVWCRASLAVHFDPEEILQVTRDCFDFQQRQFGSRYPFGDSYDQVFVPEFNAGAMENPGMVTFTDEAFVYRSRVTEGARRLRAEVIAHEMAHMWFGNLVTMRWWDGIWLNEAFAEFMGVHTVDGGTRFDGAWADFCLGRKAWGYRADQLPTTHPIQGVVSDNRAALLNFDGISYAKGASALRQLVAFVGQEVFFTGLRAYLVRHAFGNTDLADLLTELEAASGRDLRGWASSWLQTSGVATLRPVWQDGTLRVVQDSVVLRDHVLEVGFYDHQTDPHPDDRGPHSDLRGQSGSRLVLRERVSVELSGASSVVAGARPADLVLLNDRDLTFAKIRFDDRSRATVLTSLATVADPLARALCWGALWDAARDGELPAADHVAAVLAGVVVEQDAALVESLLAQAHRVAATFAPPTAQQGLLAALAVGNWQATVQPGSDLQLVRVRAAIAATTDTTLLDGLLTGTAVPPGVVVDSELRWLTIRRAATLGLLDAAGIDHELSADHTQEGVLEAAAAHASRPDPAAKQDAWDQLASGQVTNSQARYLGSGFWQHGQQDLLRPFLASYPQIVPQLWATSSPMLAASLTAQLFPSTLIEPGTALVVQTLLDQADLPAGARRVVLEQFDDLRRALSAQGEPASGAAQHG